VGAPPAGGALRSAVAIAYGVTCHALFLCAVTAIAVGLHTGMRLGRGHLHGLPAAAADFALVLQFPLLHSWLLSRPGGRLLAKLAPLGLGRSLATTTYAAIASAQLLAVFCLWSPSEVTLWSPGPRMADVMTVLSAGAWVFLLKALYDAGLPLQTGFLGWSAVVRGREPAYPPFARYGLFRLCRQPVYLGFALVLWMGPAWTLDHVLLAAAWTVYCLFGPLHKERRLLARHGQSYREYRSYVPYFVPRIRR
jgi:protein-S-isoprenylcysteine O-methyltransferase Ste14